MNLLIILTLIIFAVISTVRLNWGLFILLSLLPSYLIRFEIFSVPSTFLEMMILILFTIWFIKNKPWKRLKKKNWLVRYKKYPYRLEIILILIIAWLSLLLVNFNLSALGIFKAYFLEPIMIYILIINISKGSLKKIIWPLLISAFYLSLTAIWQQLSSSNALFDVEISSVFHYPNALGLFLGPIILLSLGLYFTYPKRTNLMVANKKIFILITIIFSLFSIILAQSFGALIAVLTASLFFLLFYNKASRKIALIIILISALSLFLYQPGYNYVKERLTLKDLSGQIRKQQWKETIEMLTDNRIITGAGLNNYQNSLSPYHQEGIFVKNDDPDWHHKTVWDEKYRKQVWQPVEIYLYPHNIFLNFWTELGLVGALIFLFLIVRVLLELTIRLKKLDKKQKAVVLGIIGSMLTVLIHGLVDVPYFKNDLALLFWTIVALAAIVKLRNSKSSYANH
jgi:O-antigen ligase